MTGATRHRTASRLLLATVACLVVVTLSGCTFVRGKVDRRQMAVDANAAALAEESRALTTGALDTLGHAPSNAPVALARRLLERDQQIEGVPAKRLDIAPILAGDPAAISGLNAILARVDSLTGERLRLEAELDQANARLQEMGRLYEAERNRSIVSRILGSLGVAGTIAAVVALFVFFPPALAIAGRLMAWLVAKLPAAAGFIGVVGTKAFDATVSGIEKARGAINSSEMEKVETVLSKSMDESHKVLVRARKAAIKNP
jgi:hypothetical protein